MKKEKLLRKLLSGSSSIRFSELQAALEMFGFRLDRISGSHHIYVHPRIPELMNIQDVKGKAKPYQVRQFLAMVERHNLKYMEEQA
jgi:predicted RNA binding protein YcfA (HicA-like mRNA interferase family)